MIEIGDRLQCRSPFSVYGEFIKLIQISDISQAGILIAAAVIFLVILVSIQFTLNQILKEVRDIRKNVAYRDYYQDTYRKDKHE